MHGPSFVYQRFVRLRVVCVSCRRLSTTMTGMCPSSMPNSPRLRTRRARREAPSKSDFRRRRRLALALPGCGARASTRLPRSFPRRRNRALARGTRFIDWRTRGTGLGRGDGISGSSAWRWILVPRLSEAGRSSANTRSNSRFWTFGSRRRTSRPRLGTNAGGRSTRGIWGSKRMGEG